MVTKHTHIVLRGHRENNQNKRRPHTNKQVFTANGVVFCLKAKNKNTDFRKIKTLKNKTGGQKNHRRPGGRKTMQELDGCTRTRLLANTSRNACSPALVPPDTITTELCCFYPTASVTPPPRFSGLLLVPFGFCSNTTPSLLLYIFLSDHHPAAWGAYPPPLRWGVMTLPPGPPCFSSPSAISRLRPSFHSLDTSRRRLLVLRATRIIHQPLHHHLGPV